jgi:hypothetical protein
MSRRFGVALVLVFLVAVVAPAPARAATTAATTAAWIRPVAGAVVRGFDPPSSRFGAGHLGADLYAPVGTPVRAAGPGVVSFSGNVAGALHVVVAHAGNLRTSYSFLASIVVRRGESVAAGQVVGTTGGAGRRHDGSVLHVALRAGDTYLDPMALFRPVDLAAVVHLAPTSEPPHPVAERSERSGILAGLAHDFGAVIGVVGKGLGAAGRSAKHVVETQLPLPAAVARGTVAYLSQQCDAHAPPADGEGGSGHRVMVVAGIESSLTGRTSSLALPTGALGYQDDEVTHFSYAADGGDYVPKDTEGPLLLAAHRFADQLRAMERREPGREVDLIAHSQGGVVIEAFLTLIYEAGDPSYPPIGTVVTLSSPLRGDPLASALAAAEHTGASVVLHIGDDAQHLLPSFDAPAVRDLARDSELMKELDGAQLPPSVQLTTIGSTTDVIVPGNAATRPGSRGATVTPHSLDAHTGIVTDPAALENVRAALEGKPLPCRSLANEIAGEVVPAAIGGIEDDAGTVLGGGRP